MSEDGFPYRLIVLRHGQSEWNAAGVFTGWENAYLTAQGELEAARAGVLLAEHGVLPDCVHTSLLRRTIQTAELALAAVDRDWVPVRRSWRLNGRHYGTLQGRRKAEAIEQYGEQQVMAWRRSYAVAPPPIDAAAAAAAAADPRYRTMPPGALPRAESLADVSARLLPYWYDAIVPDLRAGRCVLVVSHNNTLRALVKHIESIPDEQIAGLEIATGIPLVYQLGADLRPDALGGQYLDPRAARATASPSWTDQGRPTPAPDGEGRPTRGTARVGRPVLRPPFRGRASDTAAGPSRADRPPLGVPFAQPPALEGTPGQPVGYQQDQARGQAGIDHGDGDRGVDHAGIRRPGNRAGGIDPDRHDASRAGADRGQDLPGPRRLAGGLPPGPRHAHLD